jgi:hypothetical protein
MNFAAFAAAIAWPQYASDLGPGVNVRPSHGIKRIRAGRNPRRPRDVFR